MSKDGRISSVILNEYLLGGNLAVLHAKKNLWAASAIDKRRWQLAKLIDLTYWSSQCDTHHDI